MRPTTRRAYSLLVLMPIMALMLWVLGGLLNGVETETLAARHDVQAFRAELLAEDGILQLLHGEGSLSEGQRTLIDAEESRLTVSVRHAEGGKWEITSKGEALRHGAAYGYTIRAAVEGTAGDYRVRRFLSP